MTVVSEDAAADLKRRLAELEERLATALTERDAAIERQTANALVNFRLQSELRATAERQHASAEILRAISESSGDAEASLTQITETTARLFGAPSVTIRIAEGDEWIKTIRVGASSQASGAQPASQSAAPGANLPATVYQENRQIHIPDLDQLDPSMADWPLAATRAAGARTVSGTPLRRKDKAIGALIVYRDRLAPFTAEELALQQSFADQAVIAIENARLFNETKEALERQTATADILKVIASSPSDVQPVFEAIVNSVKQLLGSFSSTVFLVIDSMAHLKAFTPTTPEADAALTSAFPRPVAEFAPFQMTQAGEVMQIPDTDAESSQIRDIARARGYRSMLFAPLMNKGVPIGQISVTRVQPGRFADHDIQLLQTFADQAVIAIENTRLFNETKEALERQTATADILKVIASSPSDVQPVFAAIAERARSLLGGFSSTVYRFIEGQVSLEAFTPTTPEADEVLTSTFPMPVARFAPFEAVQAGEVTQIADTETLTGEILDIARARGFRNLLFAPLMNKGAAIGLIAVTRDSTGAFADHHVQLLKTFADQAVIAVENTRLFNEVETKTADLEESLQQQTATTDVLKVISRSAFDLQSVFDTLTASATELCEANVGIIFLRDGEVFRAQATAGARPEYLEFLKAHPRHIHDKSMVPRVARAGAVVHIPDVQLDPDFRFEGVDEARGRPARSLLGVPLLRNGTVEGVFVVSHQEVKPFTRRQVELVEAFSDQAVIALENVRLFDEVQAKTRDLEESLQQQTATADVLKVISRSVFDLQTVLDTLVESAYQLCGAKLGLLYLKGEEAFECKAVAGLGSAEASRQFKGRPIRAGRGTAAERVILTGEVHCVENLLEDPEVDPAVKDMIRNAGADAAIGGARSTLAVPMTRDNTVIGVLVIVREETGPFPARQVEILQTFADQAVIAIENARLFDEVQAKTRDLEESLQQQTATADVLKVISRSAFDLQTVLDTLVKSAAQLCEADMAAITRRIGDVYYRAGSYGFPQAFAEYVREIPVTPERRTITGRTLLEGRIVHVEDVLADPDYDFEGQELSGNPRSFLGVPLLREGSPIGALTMTRYEVRPFTQKQIELIATFADQAVIAIENVRLFDEVQARTRELAKSLDELRTAQDRLIQTEKLASLGQLTAGIAHEIKNPLNFVNNFAALSAELTDELKDVLKPAALDETIRTEVDELTGLMKDNLAKVVQHGKRADSIVKNMLLHSREGSGDHRPADVNALVEESLNLAYHGARAEKPQFNVMLKRDFDPDAGMIEAFPQEITRVLLNLISNGFYAVAKRKAEDGDATFEPVVSATTKGQRDHVEIRIRDNGTGIPPEVKEKMFNPFFTTKPAGEGTGLGLSMSHDIIVKQHGGTIDVDTLPGAFTEFRIVLPRASQFSDKSRGQT